MNATPEIRHLRHFVAVAERLHFGRAAAALHIAQPPLSRSIRDLEERVGATLLARTRRRVELTREGARFLEEAKRLLAQLESAVTEVSDMAKGFRGQLRLGFVSLADFGVLPGLLKSFKSAHPGIALSLKEMLSPEQAVALAAGELDVGLLLPPVSGSLRHIVIQEDRFVVALPARHRLARDDGPIALKHLAEDPFVMAPRSLAPGMHDNIVQMTGRAGFAPRVSQEAIQMQTIVSLVSSGLGVAIVPGSLANLRRRGVVYRPVSDPHPKLALWLAWRPGVLSEAANAFVEHAQALVNSPSAPASTDRRRAQAGI